MWAYSMDHHWPALAYHACVKGGEVCVKVVVVAVVVCGCLCEYVHACAVVVAN